jgi:hypothetical protein
MQALLQGTSEEREMMTDKQPDALWLADWLDDFPRRWNGLNEAATELRRLHEVNAELVEVLQDISAWARAYPITIFPEPDFDKAHKVLTENGMTLDAISASNMRHVITQVEKMVNAAIAKATGENNG